MENTGYIAGRSREKAILQQLAESPDAELLAVYGRRRVGKTFLITHFFRQVFQSITKTRKALFLTMVTTHGLADNAYSQELVNNRVDAESLFSP